LQHWSAGTLQALIERGRRCSVCRPTQRSAPRHLRMTPSCGSGCGGGWRDPESRSGDRCTYAFDRPPTIARRTPPRARLSADLTSIRCNANSEPFTDLQWSRDSIDRDRGLSRLRGTRAPPWRNLRPSRQFVLTSYRHPACRQYGKARVSRPGPRS